jgi:hypothetical protein
MLKQGDKVRLTHLSQDEPVIGVITDDSFDGVDTDDMIEDGVQVVVEIHGEGGAKVRVDTRNLSTDLKAPQDNAKPPDWLAL